MDSGAKFKDDLKFYYDEAFRSIQAKDFGAYATVATGDVNFKTDVYVDTFPVLTGVGIIGDNDVVTTTLLSSIVSTWTGSVSAHTFIILPKQPASLTLFDYNGFSERSYQGTRLSDVSLKYAPDGRLEADYKGKTRLSVLQAGSTVPVIGAFTPVLGWQATINLNNAQNLRVIETEINMKRAVEVLFTQAYTQSPTNIYAFPLEIDGKVTFDFVDETEYNYYRTNQQSASFTLTFVQSSISALSITIPQPVFTSYEVDRGKDYLTAVLNFKGIFSQSNSTNAKIVVYNNVTASY